MPFAWNECHLCHSKQRSYFTQGELDQLRRGTPQYRICTFCRVATSWSLVEPPKSPALQAVAVPLTRVEVPKVLVIDDDEDTLAVLRKVLVGKEFNVDAADSARGALSKMVNENYDVVISDIHMPDFDGKKLFLFIEHYMPEYRHRLLFLTGDTESVDTQTFLQQCACPYTFKPIDFDQLLGKLNELLAQQRAQPS